MARFNDRWTVLPHGPLRELDVGILTVVGQIPMPLGNFPRRMTVVRIADGGTALFSPIPLIDEEMARIERLGPPTWLIVPSGSHRLDLRPFKKRYPRARVYSPPGARAKVVEALDPDTTDDPLDDPDARLVEVGGTQAREAALIVRRPGGTSLIVNDIIASVGRPQGPGAWLMARMMGFGAHRPAVPWPIRRMLVADPAALADQLRAWSEISGLRRIIPSHGEIIDDGASAELSRLARSLR